VGLVLWIDQNTFATGLLEKVFKKKALPFYTIPNAQDFVYLVEDLKPEVIVLDTKTALDGLEAFKGQYEGIKHLPIILIDDNHELPFVENVRGHIKRPFDPFQVPQILNQILKAN
jgi:chemotaxis response regulator CheB